MSGTSAAPSPVTPTEASGPQREHAVASAITLIDRDGLSALNFRSVSAELGTAASNLHRLFHDRDDLLDGIVEAVVDELFADPRVQPDSADWHEYLVRVAHGVRRTALAHPQVFPLIASRPPAAPWIQPPLRSLRWMETFLETLHLCGFSDRNAVAVYRAFSTFLLGHLLLEVSAMGAEIGPADQDGSRTRPAQDLRDYPRLASLQAELSAGHFADEFEEALESLLDRLSHDLH